jgi:leucine dehydrogenase
MLEELIRDWSGEAVVSHYDRESDTWMFIAMHSTVLGPAGGGTRMKVYPSPADGLRDAMRLAEAMTRKMAVLDAPRGGGKAVLAVPEIPHGHPRRRLLLAYGDLVGALDGAFHTAPDVNTDDHDMDVVAERTRWASGRTEAAGGAGSSAPDTAVGVYHGIRAALAHRTGSDELRDRVIVIQGVGGVGSVLARLLAADGASLVIADADPARAPEIAADTGARVVDPDVVLEQPGDVFAPCALGGILSEATIPRLRSGIVAGAANNQLAEPEDALRLHQAGILYAPDFVINGGGVLHVLGLEVERWSRERLDERLAGIGRTLADIFRTADAEGITTELAAERLADDRIARGRSRPVVTAAGSGGERD